MREFIPEQGLTLEEMRKRGKPRVEEVTLPEGHKPTSVNEEVERRIRAAKGIPRDRWRTRAYDAMKRAVHSFTRHYPLLDSKTDGDVIDTLRLFEAVPEYSKVTSVHILKRITGNLSEEQYDVFARNIILPDLLKDIDRGMFEDRERLPFGYESRDEVQADLDNFRAIAEANPEITQALEVRRRYMNALRKALVENKLLPEKVLKDPAYYHHQVLEYMAMKRITTGTSSKDVRTHRKGWQIARRGSIKDYNTEYLESEFTVIAQGIAQLETVRTLDRLQEQADISRLLRAAARTANEREVIRRALKAHLDAGGSELDFENPYKEFRQKISMANTNLAKMAQAGQLHAPGFEEIIEGLRDSFEQYQANKKDFPDEPEGWGTPGVDDPRWFTFLSYILEKELPGANWAATVFKAIREREDFTKKYLGGAYRTWKQFLPKDYRLWQPVRGNHLYMANSLVDKVLEQVLSGEKALEDSDVRRVLAVGRRRVEWAIPTRLARTLDNFRNFRDDDAVIAAFSRRSMTSWKQWILMNALRVFKYNLNNLSGDLDICIAYAPGILRYAKEAGADLWKFHGLLAFKATKGKLFGDLREAQRLGVIGSGFAVHEVPDISDAAFLGVLTGKRVNLIKRYWNSTKEYTTWRENVLRLAAYRWFKSELQKGKKLYAASKKSEVDAIHDLNEKAAKLARELIGDYGNISKAGQWLREHLIPFWSWMEINAPRYVRLIRNLPHEGELQGKPAKVLGWKVAKGASKLAIKATLLYTAAMLWNHTFFPDEEDELERGGRRQLHLILGRREDGSIISLRFQGALSDALDWFGAEELPYDVMDVAAGRATIKEKLREKGWVPERVEEFADIPPVRRLWHGAIPFTKTIGETVMGRSTWPTPSEARPIRDRLEHVLRTVSLDMPYRHLVGKPTRGLGQDLMSVFTYTTDPGEAAYYTIRSLATDWLRAQGQEQGTWLPTAKSNALYYYKQALKYGDKKAAAKYRAEYKRLGGIERGMRQSLRMTHPLGFIAKKKRRAFISQLTPYERETYEMAVRWFQRTYKGDYELDRISVSP